MTGLFPWSGVEDRIQAADYKKYDMEGYAASSGTTGGGQLDENSSTYYKVATGDEFLAALRRVNKSDGQPAVIEITSDVIDLGINRIDSNYAQIYGSGVVNPHNPALTHPTLKETGVSRVNIQDIENLTIFSKNGATIKHAGFTIKRTHNLIIRNLNFDEFWEWDEKDKGDYDTNDWDYMVVENGSSQVWIDHCTFYKAYDGIIDIKAPKDQTSNMNVTISWCQFLPGSKDNIFYTKMMDYLYEHQDEYPFYKETLKKKGSKEAMWNYCYGQKKTHLFGASDSNTGDRYLRITLANNVYKNSMDRMPRLRFGTVHMYNCIMDSQELLDKTSVTSNGAISTCDGQLLLENCYISGIKKPLISGNSKSPTGYINAVDSVYYLNGAKKALTPQTNTSSSDNQLKVTNTATFLANLPYEDYTEYKATELHSKVEPFAGAGKINLTAKQWLMTSVEPENTESESTESENMEPENTETENIEMESTESVESESTEIENTESESTEIENTESESTEAENTEPDNTELESTEPESTEIENTEPENTEPENTEPENTESENTAPDNTELESTEPESIETESTESKSTESGSSEIQTDSQTGSELTESEADVNPISYVMMGIIAVAGLAGVGLGIYKGKNNR